MSFGKNLHKIRGEKKLTQEALAAKLNIARQTVGMWETGERTPKLEEIHRIAKALDITIARLIDNNKKSKIVIIDKNTITVDGQQIDISELETNEVKDIVEYISDIKNRKGPFPASPLLAKKTGLKKILIIDDEQELGETLYSFLVPHGYKIFLAFNGQMGLEYFEEIKPDLVFLDLKMPDIDGREVLKIIRKVSNVPIVIITAHPEDIPDIILDDLKIEGHIDKPLNLTTVLNTIKSIVGS